MVDPSVFALISAGIVGAAALGGVWLSFIYQTRAEAIRRHSEELYRPLWKAFLEWHWQHEQAWKGADIDWDKTSYESVLLSGLLNAPRNDKLRGDLLKFERSKRRYKQDFATYKLAEDHQLDSLSKSISVSVTNGPQLSLADFKECIQGSIDLFRSRERGRFEITVELCMQDTSKQRFNGKQLKFPQIQKAIYQLYDSLEKSIVKEWGQFQQTVVLHYVGVLQILERLHHITRFPRRKYGNQEPLRDRFVDLLKDHLDLQSVYANSRRDFFPHWETR